MEMLGFVPQPNLRRGGKTVGWAEPVMPNSTISGKGSCQLIGLAIPISVVLILGKRMEMLGFVPQSNLRRGGKTVGWAEPVMPNSTISGEGSCQLIGLAIPISVVLILGKRMKMLGFVPQPNLRRGGKTVGWAEPVMPNSTISGKGSCQLIGLAIPISVVPTLGKRMKMLGFVPQPNLRRGGKTVGWAEPATPNTAIYFLHFFM